jgi:hypothetical protein
MARKHEERSTSFKGAVVHAEPTFESGDFSKYVFLRRLRPGDAWQITQFLQSLDDVGKECETDERTARFGIFNINNDLVWLYENCNEAFSDSRSNMFTLHWFQ